MSRQRAEDTANTMTNWAQDIIKQDSSPIICISQNSVGVASLYVDKRIDEAKIVLMLRTLANKFEADIAKQRGQL